MLVSGARDVLPGWSDVHVSGAPYVLAGMLRFYASVRTNISTLVYMFGGEVYTVFGATVKGGYWTVRGQLGDS